MMIYNISITIEKENLRTMQDIKTYLSTAPVLATLCLGFLASLLIEINRFFPDALTFPFF
uniref:Photosystem I reaction center subunit IX n=8 Tax=Cupressaceae TaxID=3367 RepID=A0A8F5J7T4_9CONI|nr:photosystem I subunit IX [Libocedrus chevalieri]QYB22213.1 photosystem I subunit IX [Pilgerodendron uviferum]